MGEKGTKMIANLNGTGVSPSPRFFELGEPPRLMRDIGIKKSLQKGERIVSSDSEWTGCYYVVSGLIGAYGVDAEGIEALTFLLDEETLFLESNMLEDVTLARSDTVSVFVAENDTELLFFPKQKFRHLMKSDLETANFVARSIAQKMLAFRFLYNESRSHDIPWRIANLFAAFADGYGEPVGDKVKVSYRISQQLLAKMLGANRITVAKGMKRLKELGLIEKTDDFYFITDRKRLSSYLGSPQ